MACLMRPICFTVRQLRKPLHRTALKPGGTSRRQERCQAPPRDSAYWHNAAGRSRHSDMTNTVSRPGKRAFSLWPRPRLIYAGKATLLGISCLVLAGCERSAPTAPGAIPVRIEQVGSRVSSGSMTLPALIAARTESQLGMRVGGRLASRPVDRGDSVEAGAILATLDPVPLQLGVQAAQAQLAQASSAQAQADSDVARNRDLVERGAIARADFERLKTAAATAAAQVRAAASQLERARTDLADATLRAPQAGIITAALAEPGQVVAAGSPVLALAYAGELEVQADIPESLITGIETGDAATVALLDRPDNSVQAIVREVSPAADPATRTFRIRLAAPGLATEARLGMSATVNLPKRQAPDATQWTLPLSALLQQDGKTAVWVLPAGASRLELRPVTLGRLGTDDFTVTGGLAAGEQVVTAGVHRLDASQEVRPWDGRLP